jgi:BirA family biotin operon repressor/biotin-[acetyl-CoA-carboxylase] ligase
MFSMLLRPTAAHETWGTLSLVAAVALEATLREVAGVAASLKWPNDVLVGERKTCGILAAVEGDAVIIGLGLNVSLTEAELPTPDATSLALAGATTLDRNRLLAEFLRRFADLYRTWEDRGPADAVERWRRASATLGNEVAVSFPNGDSLTGTAVGIGEDGRLRIRCHHGEGTESETVAVAAGDIVHLRPKG